MFLYQKQIDRSTLRQGFQIPVESHYQMSGIPGGMPQYGKTRNITILIDGTEYYAQLKIKVLTEVNTMGMQMYFKCVIVRAPLLQKLCVGYFSLLGIMYLKSKISPKTSTGNSLYKFHRNIKNF